MRRTVTGPLALLLAFVAAAPAAVAADAEIPAALRADVARAEAVGALLHRNDQAAWHTSDALLAAQALASPPGEGRGWLTLDVGGKVVVRYFAEVDWMPMAFAQADFDPATGKATNARRLSPAQAPTAEERALLKARDAAAGAVQASLRCSANVNTVVLPRQGAGKDETHVYFMSAWAGGPFVFGGHQRVRVSGDGAKVLDVYEHTRGCVPIDVAEGVPEGATPVGAMVSHLTSPAPNEFHVFLARQHRTPVMVMTAQNEKLWKVEDGRIRAMALEEAQ
jgi:hypothetical protein